MMHNTTNQCNGNRCHSHIDGRCMLCIGPDKCPYNADFCDCEFVDPKNYEN